jgi:hypothetical protein
MNNEEKIALLRAQQAEIESAREKLAGEKLKLYEDKILDDCMQIISPVLQFYKVDPENPTAIPKSISNLSLEQQEQWMRIARAAWASNKDAPIAIKLAFTTMQGIMNARAKQVQEGNVLNIQTANFVNPTPKFDVIVEDE